MIDPKNLPAPCFDRADPTDDALFYLQPRKVVHIDEWAIASLRDFLSGHLTPGGTYLDLMSSWRSHLPPDHRPARVIGLGLNAEEMEDNPQLDEWIVHNLNTTPRLPFDDQIFDAAVCTVSIQYMTRPIDVFRDINRVLKPGAPFILSFSNRCFPQKAIALWLAMTDAQHVELVKNYFNTFDAWDEVQTWDNLADIQNTDPLFIVWANRKSG